MPVQRRLLPVEVFDWLELLQLVRQGWIVNVQSAITIAAGTDRQVYFSLVTHPNVVYVWTNQSQQVALQARELRVTEAQRRNKLEFSPAYGPVMYH